MRRYGVVLLVLSLAGWVISWVHRMMVPPLLPIIMGELGINNAQAGLLMSGFLISYALAQVPSGYLGDKYGARKVVPLGMAAFSLSTLLIGFSRNFEQFLALRVLFGLFAGTYFPSIVSAILSAFPKNKRGKAIGIFMSGASIGRAIAPLVSVPIALSVGWRSAFPILSVPGFLIATALFFILKDEDRAQVSRSLTWKGVVSPKFISACGVAFLGMASFMAFTTFLPLFLVDQKDLSIEMAAAFSSVIPVIGFLGNIVGGYLADRLDKGSLISASNLISAFLIWLTYLSPQKSLIFILLLFGFANSLVPAPIISLVTSIIPSEKRASALALQNTMTFVGASLGTSLGGILLDKIGYRGLFFFLALNLLIGGLLSFTLKEKAEVS